MSYIDLKLGPVQVLGNRQNYHVIGPSSVAEYTSASKALGEAIRLLIKTGHTHEYFLYITEVRKYAREHQIHLGVNDPYEGVILYTEMGFDEDSLREWRYDEKNNKVPDGWTEDDGRLVRSDGCVAAPDYSGRHGNVVIRTPYDLFGSTPFYDVKHAAHWVDKRYPI